MRWLPLLFSLSACTGHSIDKAACNAGNASACSMSGHKYLGEGKINLAAQEYKKACQQGYPWACRKVAELYLSVGSETFAMRWYKQACRLRDPESCDRLNMHELKRREQAHKAEVERLRIAKEKQKLRDYVMQQRRLKIAELEEKKEALRLKRFREKRLIALQEAQAKRIAAEQEAQAKRIAAEQEAERRKKEKFHADMAAYQKRCDSKDAEACYQLSLYNSALKNTEEVGANLKKACRLGNVSGCYFLSIFWANQKQYTKQVASLRLACNLKHQASCDRIAPVLKEHFPKEYVKLMSKRCLQKNGEACFIMGKLYRDVSDGDGYRFLKKSILKQMDYFKKGCIYKVGKSCRSVAQTYNDELHKVRDTRLRSMMKRKIKHYLELACKFDNTLAHCEE